MSLNRYDARTDANQATIIKALRSIGCKAVYVKKPLDLIVSGGPLGKRNLLMECKMPGEKLSREQQEFWDGWPGEKCLVYDEREAIEAVLGKELLR